jgi:hypothetical protein
MLASARIGAVLLAAGLLTGATAGPALAVGAHPAAAASASGGLSPLAIGGISLAISIAVGYVIGLINRKNRK